jgi:hypothetical protein
MTSRITLTILLICLSTSSFAGTIYRWVDEKGIVHYGDTVPEKYKATATDETALKNTQPITDEAASHKREKARDVLKHPPSTQEPAVVSPSDTVNSEPDSKNTEKSACEQQWKQYVESLECFAPYRNALGGIKAEAYNYCTEVAQPALCK